MNKEDVEKIGERISELTRKWESNQMEIMRHQQEIIRLQQEVARLLEVDHSLRGGLSELGRLLKDQAPKEESPEEEAEEKKDGKD